MDTYEKLEILKRLLILALAISVFILLKLLIYEGTLPFEGNYY